MTPQIYEGRIKYLAKLFSRRKELVDEIEKIDAEIIRSTWDKKYKREGYPKNFSSKSEVPIKKRGRPKSDDEELLLIESPMLIDDIQAMVNAGANTSAIAKKVNLTLAEVNDLFRRGVVHHRKDEDDDYFTRSNSEMRI